MADLDTLPEDHRNAVILPMEGACVKLVFVDQVDKIGQGLGVDLLHKPLHLDLEGLRGAHLDRHGLLRDPQNLGELGVNGMNRNRDQGSRHTEKYTRGKLPDQEKSQFECNFSAASFIPAAPRLGFRFPWRPLGIAVLALDVASIIGADGVEMPAAAKRTTTTIGAAHADLAEN